MIAATSSSSRAIAMIHTSPPKSDIFSERSTKLISELPIGPGQIVCTFLTFRSQARVSSVSRHWHVVDVGLKTLFPHLKRFPDRIFGVQRPYVCSENQLNASSTLISEGAQRAAEGLMFGHTFSLLPLLKATDRVQFIDLPEPPAEVSSSLDVSSNRPRLPERNTSELLDHLDYAFRYRSPNVEYLTYLRNRLACLRADLHRASDILQGKSGCFDDHVEVSCQGRLLIRPKYYFNDLEIYLNFRELFCKFVAKLTRIRSMEIANETTEYLMRRAFSAIGEAYRPYNPLDVTSVGPQRNNEEVMQIIAEYHELVVWLCVYPRAGRFTWDEQRVCKDIFFGLQDCQIDKSTPTSIIDAMHKKMQNEETYPIISSGFSAMLARLTTDREHCNKKQYHSMWSNFNRFCVERPGGGSELTHEGIAFLLQAYGFLTRDAAYDRRREATERKSDSKSSV